MRLTRLFELLIAKTTDSKYLLDRELLLTRKLLYQGLLIARLMSLHRKCYARHHGLQLVNRDGVSVLQITNNCSPSQSQSRPPKCFITYHQESHLLPELLTFPEHLSSSAFHWGVCCPTVCFRGTRFWLLLLQLPFLLWSFYSRSVFSLWLLVPPFYSRSVGLPIMASGYPTYILKLFEKTYIHVV